MKIIDLEQGSEQWLSWRKTVITATDCACILGSSPWTTAYKCWQRKLGMIEEQKSNEAMERGKRLEPEARDQSVTRLGIDMNPAVVCSTKYEFLGASLDGISPCERFILEIKCGGTKLHSMAEKGVIPEYYMDQVQHQLLVTGAEKCYYYSYDGTNGICIEVLPDSTFADRFLPKARAFWKCIANCEPPEMQEADFVNMSENLDWRECSKMYQETDMAIKFLEEKKENLRKRLITMCADHNCSGGGIKIIKSVLRGRIAYDEIPEIKSVDLDKYRKASTTSWKILLEANRQQ